MGQAQILEIATNPLLQLPKSRGNEIGGKFFSADLKKERVRHSTRISKKRLYWKPLIGVARGGRFASFERLLQLFAGESVQCGIRHGINHYQAAEG